MIDERTLTDATRCPSCSGPLLHVVSCPTCGIDLSGSNARAVWQVSVQAAGLLTERTRLIAALRVEASTRPADSSAPAQLWTLPHPTRRTAGVSESTNRGPGPGVAVHAAAPATPAPEWTRRKVANLLLSLGVGLLAVAAVVFLVVSWSVLGIGGRAVVMTGATLLAGAGAALASRRGLGSTAEAVSLLTVGLGLLDALGARNAGLAGLDNVDGLVYWAGAFAVVAALSAATAAVVPTRSLRIAAGALGQLAVPLLTVHLADVSDHPAAVTAAGFTLAAVAAIGLAALRAIATPASAVPAGAPVAEPSGGSRWPDVRVVLGLGGGLAWLVACLAAVVAAYGEAGSLASGTVLLLALAAVAACAVLAGSRLPALATAGVTAAAALVVAAAWSVPADRADAAWLPVVLSAVAVALLAAGMVVSRAHRTAAALVALVAAVAPGLAAFIPAGGVLLGQLGWLDRPWQGGPHGGARQMLTFPGFSPSFTWGTEIPLLLACVVVALVVADRLHGLRPVALAAVPLAALAVATLPVAQDMTFAVTVAIDLAVAAALLLPGTWLLRRGHVAWGAVSAVTGLVGLGLAVSWSLALASTTIAALASAAVLLAGGALLVGGRPSEAVVRLSLGIAATLSAIADVAALVRAGGAGWSAVWSLTFGLALVAASAAAGLLSGAVRRGFVVTATVSLLAEAAALTLWGGGSAASAGLAVTVVAGGSAAAAVWLDTLVAAAGRATPVPVARRSSMSVLSEDVAVSAALGGLVGIAFAAPDPDRLWLALLAAGVAASVVSLRSGLHRVAWAGAALLVASSWVRLVLSHVDAPEPYTVPAGAALIVLGLWRRRREPTYSSWRAYGTGLGLAMGPSLLRAVADPGSLRPMLLGLAALVVLCSGIARLQKAPLFLGGIVLAVDGIVQLSPYIAAFYAGVPRWSLIAAAGLLLLTLGMTYERRARDLRALQHQISRFG